MSIQTIRNQLDIVADGIQASIGRLAGGNVLVTGATGLVGLNIVAALLLYGDRTGNSPKVYALVRDIDKAKKRFTDLPQDNLVLVKGDVTSLASLDLPVRVDYIVHAAARTDSRGMVQEPVSVINTTLDGTRNVLQLAADRGDVRKVVYVSSMEVYGAHATQDPIDEHAYGLVDPLSVRSSYPEAKRMAEALCCAYASEFGAQVCIARLAQTFGPGIPSNDQRVFAYLTRCARDGHDIALATDGASTRMYVSAADAASAILVLLADGQAGEAYNVANEDTYCSVLEMAEMVARELGDGHICVHTGVGNDGKYPPAHHLRMDTSKMRTLGWSARISLPDMYHSIMGEV